MSPRADSTSGRVVYMLFDKYSLVTGQTLFMALCVAIRAQQVKKRVYPGLG